MDRVAWKARYDAAVAKGAALLDEVDPAWLESIDKWLFDVRDRDHCVMGQWYGGYLRGLGRLGLEKKGGQDYGFDIMFRSRYPELKGAADGDDLTSKREHYDILQESWRDLFKSREGTTS